MNDTRPLIIAGSIAIDRLMKLDDRFANLIKPDQLDHLSISPLLADMADSLGGVGPNIAYNAALLGNHPVLLGSAGYDADAYMQKLTDDGIDITHVHRSPEKLTASCAIITDSVQSQIGGFYPGAMADSAKVTLEPFKDINPVVVIGPHDPAAMKRQVAECKQWGLNLVYDIGQQVASLPVEDLLEGLDAARMLILNKYELELFCQKTGLTEEAIKQQVSFLVITLGKEGSRIEGREVLEPITVGVAEPLVQLDPTGAGDAYRGGFLHGFIRSWPLLECARVGSVMGSFALEDTGTQNHHPTIEQIHERYQQAFNQPFPNYERK